MAIKSREYPEEGELVIGTITKVNPYSVFISLDEYKGKEGMVHISEVARKWIRDIRDFVKIGQKTVAVVLKVERGHIALSMKRISERQGEEKMKEFKREQKAEKLLEFLAKEEKMSLDEAYNQIGFKLKDAFGEVFKAFQISLKNEELLRRKGIEERWIKALKSVAEKHMEIKENIIKGILELKCYEPDGVSVIKSAIAEAIKKYSVDVKYISAPKYMLRLKTADAKSGEKTLSEAAELIIKDVEKNGGEGKFSKG